MGTQAEHETAAGDPRWTDRLARGLFFLAVAIALVGYGVAIQQFHLFPYSLIKNALKTANVLLGRTDEPEVVGFADQTPQEAASRRFEILDPAGFRDRMLVYGGPLVFPELGEQGALAVVVEPGGVIGRSVPFKPRAIFDANTITDCPYEEQGFDPADESFRPVGVHPYPNGDLLVTFHNARTFPYAGGVARVNTDGDPVWFRRDYSHHWALIRDDGSALVPALRIAAKPVRIKVGDQKRTYARSTLLDEIHVLDSDGNVTRTIPIFDAIAESPHAALLLVDNSGVDPTHLNYLGVLPPDFPTMDDAAPGDLVISLRNLSAFAILDFDTGDIKKIVRGSFVRQHAVTYWQDAKFLMFDNLGGDTTGGPSRLLSVDLATGSERTIFPNAQTPENLRDLFTHNSGKVSISPDRTRALVVFTNVGTAVEVRLADGKALGVFRSIHDLSNYARLNEQQRTAHAAIVRLRGMDYYEGDDAR